MDPFYLRILIIGPNEHYNVLPVKCWATDFEQASRLAMAFVNGVRAALPEDFGVKLDAVIRGVKPNDTPLWWDFGDMAVHVRLHSIINSFRNRGGALQATSYNLNVQTNGDDD